MAGGAGSLNAAAAATTGAITLGAGGAASDYFTGDCYLIPVSTNLLLEDDVSSLVMPTDVAVPLLAYFLVISSCLTSSVRAATGVTVVISGMIILNLLFSNFSSNLLSSSSVRSLLKPYIRD